MWISVAKYNIYIYVYFNVPTKMPYFCSPYMADRLLYSYKLKIKLYFRLNGHISKRKKSTKDDSFATPVIRASSKPALLFLKALLLGKAAQTTMLSGEKNLATSHSIKESLQVNGFPSVNFAVDMARCRDA